MSTLIIDAWNVIHAWKKTKPSSPFTESEHAFLKFLAGFADIFPGKLIVVFDGLNSYAESVRTRFPQLEILFSEKTASADSIIERLAQDLSSTGRVTVVTYDRIEGWIASGGGASLMSPLRFFEMVSGELQRIQKEASSAKGGGKKTGFPIEDLLGPKDFSKDI